MEQESPTSIRVVSAMYGTGSEFADVTQKVAELAQEGFLYVGEALGDPFPYRRKHLRIAYEAGGKRYEDVVPERGMFVAKPLAAQGLESLGGEEFRVESATFGANRYVDFTEIARDIFRNPFECFDIISPRHGYGNPFPDPEPGLTKYYVIRFVFKSRTFLSVSREPDCMIRLLAPIFSVIIPTWNRSEFLPRCIESILGQDLLPKTQLSGLPGHSRIEIVVVDDGSTDNTREVMSNMCNAHPCITYLRIPHTGCIGMVRNFGIKISTGKFIANLDSDDKYLPCHLSKIYERFLSSTDTFIVRTQSRFCRLKLMPDGSIQETEETDFGKVIYNRWNTYPSCCAYSRELVNRLVPNIYPEQHWPMAAKTMGEDELFYDVVKNLGIKVTMVEEPTIMYGLIYNGNNVTYNVPVIAAAYRDRELPDA